MASVTQASPSAVASPMGPNMDGPSSLPPSPVSGVAQGVIGSLSQIPPPDAPGGEGLARGQLGPVKVELEKGGFTQDPILMPGMRVFKGGDLVAEMPELDYIEDCDEKEDFEKPNHETRNLVIKIICFAALATLGISLLASGVNLFTIPGLEGAKITGSLFVTVVAGAATIGGCIVLWDKVKDEDLAIFRFARRVQDAIDSFLSGIICSRKIKTEPEMDVNPALAHREAIEAAEAHSSRPAEEEREEEERKEEKEKRYDQDHQSGAVLPPPPRRAEAPVVPHNPSVVDDGREPGLLPEVAPGPLSPLPALNLPTPPEVLNPAPVKGKNAAISTSASHAHRGGGRGRKQRGRKK